VVCDDGDPCTTDFCDRASGCVYRPNTLACDDGNPCTTDDRCAAGVCAGTWNESCCQADADCADSNPCTQDRCDTGTGTCSWDGAPLDGTPCPDRDACTRGDQCQGGLCRSGERTVCEAPGLGQAPDERLRTAFAIRDLEQLRLALDTGMAPDRPVYPEGTAFGFAVAGRWGEGAALLLERDASALP
jgi:hypothetical protein